MWCAHLNFHSHFSSPHILAYGNTNEQRYNIWIVDSRLIFKFKPRVNDKLYIIYNRKFYGKDMLFVRMGHMNFDRLQSIFTTQWGDTYRVCGTLCKSVVSRMTTKVEDTVEYCAENTEMEGSDAVSHGLSNTNYFMYGTSPFLEQFRTLLERG